MRSLFLTSLAAATLIFTACGTHSNKDLSIKDAHNPDIGGGRILFYTTQGNFIDAANVGNLPDMVTLLQMVKQFFLPTKENQVMIILLTRKDLFPLSVLADPGRTLYRM